MRQAYSKGGNAMEWCRDYFRTTHKTADGNNLLATLVAYDLQAGSYISAARAHPENNRRWCRQLAGLLAGVLDEGDSIMEVGVGEATTLAGVLAETGAKVGLAFGFDVSWSRVAEGRKWLAENGQEASLFVADLLNIPLADGSVDVVYSSHSLEPNRGKEEEALRECLRVARKAVVLVEPVYELASADAQARMRHHGYVEGLRETAERLGAEVVDYRLLDYAPNPLNPSGVLCLRKAGIAECGEVESRLAIWRCPMTGVELETGSEFFYASEVGLAYPVLRGIPMLRAEHGIVASKLSAAIV
jgi:SAM-dependent methyltransferase